MFLYVLIAAIFSVLLIVVIYCTIPLPNEINMIIKHTLKLHGLEGGFTGSTVTASGHYCFNTKHAQSHLQLSYARASYSNLATPEGMLITFSLALN